MPTEIFERVLINLPPYSEPLDDQRRLDDLARGADYPIDKFEMEPTVFSDNESIPISADENFDPEPEEIEGEESRAAEGMVRERGIDVLAFYKSYRHLQKSPFPGKWGVFFVNQGIKHIAHLLALEFPGLEQARKIAFDFLWSHEIYHAKFDVALLGFEALNARHFYLPQQSAFKWCQTQQPEEALANLNAWEFAKKIDPAISRSAMAHLSGVHGISEFFFNFMKCQPGAYARFDEDKRELKSETAAGVFKGLRFKQARCDELVDWVAHSPSRTCNRSDVPQHLILGVRYSKLISPVRFIPHVTEIKESSQFLKDLVAAHKPLWDRAKKKLLASSCLPGLNFKFWEEPETWSMRVNDNFRAHLKPISIQEGVWSAVSYGSHKKMGHG